MEYASKFTSLSTELLKIRKALRLSRKEMSIMFGVSSPTIDSWLTRSKQPSLINYLQSKEFIENFKKPRIAFGIIISPDESINENEYLKRKCIVEQYCKSTMLNLFLVANIKRSKFISLNSLHDLYNLNYTEEKGVKHIVFYAEDSAIPSKFMDELVDSGIECIHYISNGTVKVDRV